MKMIIDTESGELRVLGDDPKVMDLHSPEAFHLLSRVWVTTGWGLRYTYGFSWFGRPIIQLPEDMIVAQEVIYRVKPDVIIETGVAHGGSLVYYASLMEAMGNGSVIGVDVEIRSHNREAIEAHDLFDRITLVEGSSVDPVIVDAVRSSLVGDPKVMVILDSNHSKEHVLAELDAYSPLVTPGSYIVATDGVMEWLAGVPGAGDGWRHDNPKSAVEEWLGSHPEFVLEEPPSFVFNEGEINERVTHWPSGYLRRVE